MRWVSVLLVLLHHFFFMMRPFTSPTDITSAKYRRPYLNLKEKLSQTLLNPYTVFLSFLILKVFFFVGTLGNSFAEAKKHTQLLYLSTQSYVDNVVSFPHYMALGANMALAKGLEETNKGFVESLKLMLTAAEEMIFFMIELSVGTYACLLMAVVDSTAIAALNATEDVISIANDTLISFANDLNTGLGDLTNIINDVIDTAEDTSDALKHMFSTSSTDNTKQIKISEQMAHVNLTIKNMQDWMIPDSINTDIEKLKTKVIDFNDVKNYTQTLIDIPFNEIKRQINKNLNQTFDASTFYVPNKKSVQLQNATTTINDFYDNLQSLSVKTGHSIMILLGLVMLVFILYTSYIELRNWKRVNFASKELYVANSSYTDTPSKCKFNIEVVSVMQDLTSDKIGKFVSTKIARLQNPVYVNNMRWMVSYIASPYLLSFFLLGLLGILSFICQYIVLLLIMHAHDIGNQVTTAFDNTSLEIKQSMNGSIYEWSNETNIYLQSYQDEINDNLLGWIDTSTTAINNTVTKFDDDMNAAIDDLFKGTPLYDPVEKIVWCVIESKLKKIEEAMTWLNENAQLNIGDINPEEIMNKMTQMTESSSDGTDLGDKITELKTKTTELFQNVMAFHRKETFLMLYISLGIWGVWLVFVFIGIAILLYREHRIHWRESTFVEKLVPDVVAFNKYSSPVSSSHTKRMSVSKTISNLYQTMRDMYFERESYVRTPLEPTMNTKEMCELRKTFEAEKEESCKSIWDRSFDIHTTLTDIDENSLSMQCARKWTP